MFNRRSILRLFGLSTATVVLTESELLALDGAARVSKPMTWLGPVKSFDELKTKLAAIPDQCIGRASSICQTVDKYEEISVRIWSRPDDLAHMESVAANEMATCLSRFLSGKEGRLYWRIPLETEIRHAHQVLRWDDNGPDFDFILDRRGYFDKDWRQICAYARLYRAAT